MVIFLTRKKLTLLIEWLTRMVLVKKYRKALWCAIAAPDQAVQIQPVVILTTWRLVLR